MRTGEVAQKQCANADEAETEVTVGLRRIKGAEFMGYALEMVFEKSEQIRSCVRLVIATDVQMCVATCIEVMACE